MPSEISRRLSSIPYGLDLKYLAKDFEDRGFMTKESLKYIDSSDVDVLFPSPLKLSYAKKKILLKVIEQLSNKYITQEPFGGTKTQSAAHITVGNRGIRKEEHPSIATSPGSGAGKRNTDS